MTPTSSWAPGTASRACPGKRSARAGRAAGPTRSHGRAQGEERGRRWAPDSRRSFPCFEWPALLQMRLVWQARRGRPSHVTATETRDMLSQLSPRLGLPRCSWGCRSPVFCHRPLETGAGPPSLRGLEGAPGRRSAPPREPHAPSLLLVTAWRLPSRQPLLKAEGVGLCCPKGGQLPPGTTASLGRRVRLSEPASTDGPPCRLVGPAHEDGPAAHRTQGRLLVLVVTAIISFSPSPFPSSVFSLSKFRCVRKRSVL